jgi:hypothetical protein
MRTSKSLFKLNRVLILVFILMGLASDGFQYGDVFFAMATVLWIWLPFYVRLETTVINQITHTESYRGEEQLNGVEAKGREGRALH